jgi:hypothetical protein
MSEASSVEEILHHAERLEKEYDWLGVSESYEKALNLLGEDDFPRKGEVHERQGYALIRFAFQAESNDEFRQRLHQSILSYEKTKELYGRSNESTKMPRMLRCDAVIAYLNHWLAVEASERKRQLERCWTLTKEALESFMEDDETREYGKTYNQLSLSAYLLWALEWSFQAAEKVIKEAIECGEQTITFLSGLNDPYELARAYVKTANYLALFGYCFIPDMDEKSSYYQKCRHYWQNAIELSENTALIELSNSAMITITWNFEEALVHFEKSLRCLARTKDKYLTGNALDMLAYNNFWKARGTEDPDKWLEIGQRALQCAEDAKHQFSSIFPTSPPGFYMMRIISIWYHWESARREIDLRKRLDLLEKATMEGTQAVKLAKSTGCPWSIAFSNYYLSASLGSLAQMETNTEEKRRLLEKALEQRNENIRISARLFRFQYWDRGSGWNFLADLKAELSKVEKDFDKRRKILQEAVSYKKHCLQLCGKETPYYEMLGALSILAEFGMYQYSYGELLSRLYEFTSNNEHQRKAIRAFEETIESFKKLDMVSQIAQCYWRIAGGYDTLGEHLSAAESFNFASNNYTSAAEKIPQLKNFYRDHALYMQAWSEIEKARHDHGRQEYGLAKEHFEKAADLHRSLKQWNYMAPNYSAWAQIENAEELSNKEQSEEAIKAFRQAATLFSESNRLLQTQLSKIEDTDEEQMASSMTKASDTRHEYCDARITLEEARILDKKGEHLASSGKYGQAADALERIGQTLESQQERKEFQFIIDLSRAWQKMMMADAKASPELYLEASSLFEHASKESSNEMTGLLALGHSRFCRALETGTRFADTGDVALHTVTVQHLESASKYYVKAGFQSVSEYAKATGLLFDAYVHMDKAKKEEDQEKKVKLYTIAEKVLQTSAGFYLKAGHPEKREQVMRLLDKVKEERELAVSIAEVLHTPTVVSATTSFVAPTPTSEEAVGSERFEHADIQANLITRQKDLKVGEDLDIALELVNAGKGPALLTKVTDIIPKGFKLRDKPQAYRVEDSYLNMKGKRLDPLKTEEVKLVLQPTVQGTFSLKPTVLYLDENGNYKSHEPEPISITVKELGIKGWLKGER